MTVAELIAELSEAPKHLEVYFYYDGGHDHLPIRTVIGHAGRIGYGDSSENPHVLLATEDPEELKERLALVAATWDDGDVEQFVRHAPASD